MPFRIVVPVDGSKPAAHAVAWAVAFAQRTGAAVSVCSVVDPMLACMAGAGGAAVDPGPMLDTLEADAAAFCAAAGERAAAHHVLATTSILHGQPASAIDAFALSERADIVALGTHARYGLARGILGSVTASVIESSSVAVLAVRAETTLKDGGPIVVAVDASAASAAATRFALKIARALAVPISLVHVCVAGERAARSSQAALAERAHDAAAAGVACTVENRQGEPIQALIAAATECGASMLATGTHGRGALRRLFLGSVAEGCLRNAIVPVLIVRNAALSVPAKARALEGDLV